MQKVRILLTEELIEALNNEAEEIRCSPQALLIAATRQGLQALSSPTRNPSPITRTGREVIVEDARLAEEEIEKALYPETSCPAAGG